MSKISGICGQKPQKQRASPACFSTICAARPRNLRRAGIAEGVIIKIGGWRTRSVFERYAIVSQTDIADALKKLETS